MDLLDMLDRLEQPPLVAPDHYTDEVYSVVEFERCCLAWAEEGCRLGSVLSYPGRR